MARQIMGKKKGKPGKPGRVGLYAPVLSYAGQQHSQLTIAAAPQLWTTTVTTGVIAATIEIDPTVAITGWASRFAAVYEEFRTVGAIVRIRPVAASTGVTKFFFDEKSNSAPTLNDAKEKNGRWLVNSNAASSACTEMRFRTTDLLDLEYSSVGSAKRVCSFKLYTDNANYGAAATATALWITEVDYIVQFRGIIST